MLNFIVLGYVPGTNVQLSFYALLLIYISLFSVALTIYALRHNNLKRWAEQIILSFISLS